jgi:hypothetical protein
MPGVYPVTDRATGYTVLATDWNQLADNSTDANTRLSTVETRTTDATTGNTQLGSRVTTLETRTTDVSTGNTALGTRVSALETTRAQGWWKATDSTQNIPYGGAPTAPTLLFGTVVKTATGLSYSSGVVTVSSGYQGWYAVSAQFDINASNTTTHNVAIQIVSGDGSIAYGSDQGYYPTNAYTSLTAVADAVYLNAADTFKAILWVYTGTGTGNYTNSGPGINRTHLRARWIGA